MYNDLCYIYYINLYYILLCCGMCELAIDIVCNRVFLFGNLHALMTGWLQSGLFLYEYEIVGA